MALVSSWDQKGIERGKAEDELELLTHFLRRRIYHGDIPAHITERLDGLSAKQLDDLIEALLDFVCLLIGPVASSQVDAI